MNIKQRRFVDEYLKDFNATNAAKRAGYSERTARQIGSENLSKPYIADEINRRVEELAMGADERLITISEIARYSKRDSDRLRAAELLGKLAGDYVDRQETSGTLKIEYVNDWRNGDE